MSESITFEDAIDLLAKAAFLVEHKGEMSVELWNDRAQCVLAPMAAELAEARAWAKRWKAAAKACNDIGDRKRMRVTNELNDLGRQHAELRRLARAWLDERDKYGELHAREALRRHLEGAP